MRGAGKLTFVTASAAKPDPGPVHQSRGLRLLVVWLAAALVRLWSRTLRVSCDLDGLRKIAQSSGPLTLLLWHNRLFIVPWLVRHAWTGRQTHALVSASRDGADLARFFNYMGVGTVRGSSSRFGREALRDLIGVQRAGSDIAITPDGPRGPVYQMKAGAVLTARRTHSSLLLFGLEYQGAWRLRSWDRFFIPKPFSRAVLRFELIDPQTLAGGFEGVEFVRERMLVLSGESPAVWPAVRESADADLSAT